MEPQRKKGDFKQGKDPRRKVGRPKGAVGGRTKALHVLDAIFADEGNLKKLKDALQAWFDKSPVAFFKLMGVPLIPKKAIEGGDDTSNDVGYATMTPAEAAQSMDRSTSGEKPENKETLDETSSDEIS